MPRTPTNDDLGRGAEFLTMARLQYAGVYCVHSDSYSDDVWIKLGDGSIYTVQVKASTLHANSYRRKEHYMFSRKANAIADIYAFVAVDLDLVIFKLQSEFNVRTIRLSRAEFTKYEQDASMRRVLNEIASIKSVSACATF